MCKLLSVVMVGLLVAGCSFKSGMNAQRSSLRGTGDLAVTVALDVIPNDATALAVNKKVKEVAIAVQLFLKNGKVADLTLPEFTDVLRKLIPEDYRFLFDIMLAQIQGVTLPVDKIGANNIERINSVCVGLIVGCDLYDMKYRPVKDPAAPVVADKAVAPVDTKAFGARLKKEMRVR